MDKPLGYVYNIIFFLNLAVVILFSLIMYQTTDLVCEADQARIFLEQARYLPHIPWHVPVYAITSFLLLGVSTAAKRAVGESSSIILFSLFLIDIGIALFISYNLNFSYKGLFLFLGASAFFFIGHPPLRYVTIGLIMLGYTFTDYDIISVRLNLVSLQDYISFYGSNAQIPLYSMLSTLESLNLILVILFFQFLIQSKVRENKEFIKVNNELSDKLHQLEILQAQVEESARLKERNRLAHEIHDILGHTLTSISTALEASLELARQGSALLLPRLENIKSIADKGLSEIRRSVKELKSDAIERSSLLTALQELINDANSLGQVCVGFSIRGNTEPLEDDEEQTVYRLIQESLTNSYKYAQANRIDILLDYSGPSLAVEIADNGVGRQVIRKNFGLKHIEEQIHRLGGDVVFYTRPGYGFRTSATIPRRKGGSHS